MSARRLRTMPPANPELFQVRKFDQTWPGRFVEANVALGKPDRYDARLQELLRKNSRGTHAEVEDLLRREQRTPSRRVERSRRRR